ncbi:MAG: hypothetical protein AAF297_02255 [Planctomycetota bacterium]
MKRTQLATLAMFLGAIPAGTAGILDETPVFHFEIWSDRLPLDLPYDGTIVFVDEVPVAWNESVVVPGATTGTSSFEISGTIETIGAVRTVLLQMDAVGNSDVFLSGSNWFDLPGSFQSGWGNGTSLAMGLDLPDAAQGAPGQFTRSLIGFSISGGGAPNSSRAFGNGTFDTGQSVYTSLTLRREPPTTNANPLALGSEFLITGLRLRLQYPVITGGACNLADMALPHGILDLDDVDVFVSAFLSASSEDQATIDFAPPFGVIDLFDTNVFIGQFLSGCP